MGVVIIVSMMVGTAVASVAHAKRVPCVTEINVRRLNLETKVNLLEQMWYKQHYAEHYRLAGIEGPPFSPQEARRALTSGTGYIDYLCGKRFELDTRKRVWDLRGYARDPFGPNARMGE